MPHLSARMRSEVVDNVFLLAGGQEKLLAFVEKNDENYQFFLQHCWAKGLPRVSNAEVTVAAESVEDLVARLDAGEHARVVSPDGGAHFNAEPEAEAA